MLLGRNVPDEICNKTVWNKCQINSSSIATLSFKMRFNFFQYNNETLKRRDSGFSRPIGCFLKTCIILLACQVFTNAMSHIIFLPFSLNYSIRWAPNVRCLVAHDAFTRSTVPATTIDDAVDQWRKRLHCYPKTSGRHFEHLF